MSEIRIVVVGAGVSGLTTALLLSKNPAYKITVLAKHMPGDNDIEYASPWAGANYLPVSEAGTVAADVEARTWPELERLARDHPESGIHFQETAIYANNDDAAPSPWWKDIVPNFRVLPPSDLAGYDTATAFTSVCINPTLYLPYLLSQNLARGVSFHRAIIPHIAAAATHPHGSTLPPPAHLIINCTGLSARTLPGVLDTTLLPARGQTVLVRNEVSGPCACSRTADGNGDEMAYVMQRAGGGGTLLGGCYQRGNWDARPDPELAVRIMRRAVRLCPSLTGGRGVEALSIIRHGVGLRPVRVGGARLEREWVDGTGDGMGDGKGVWVVHNYGHGGFGYQSSYGCAERVVGLVGEVVGELGRAGEGADGVPKEVDDEVTKGEGGTTRR